MSFWENRRQFTYAVETCSEWVLLGLQAGSFLYALGNGKEDICLAGDFVLCPPGVPLRRAATRTMNFHFFRFRWKVPYPDKWKGKHTVRDIIRFDSTLAYLRASQNEMGRLEAATRINHLLSDLLHQRAYEFQNAPEKEVPDNLMLKISKQLQTSLSDRETLQDIARSFRITPFQLSRRFRAEFGMSPALYRTTLRIRYARELLLGTTWTTERIAEACGFENAFYFSRVFSRQTGQPPREFRTNNRV